jgi:phage shock protein PspC (stress-responsive transcriptional regulator)
MMSFSATNVLTRDDTFFGVCEALGEDLRIPPNLIRLAFAAGLFFSPLAAIGAYAVLGLFMGLLRWFVPNPRVEPAPEPEFQPAAEAPEELAIAA